MRMLTFSILRNCKLKRSLYKIVKNYSVDFSQSQAKPLAEKLPGAVNLVFIIIPIGTKPYSCLTLDNILISIYSLAFRFFKHAAQTLFTSCLHTRIKNVIVFYLSYLSYRIR